MIESIIEVAKVRIEEYITLRGKRMEYSRSQLLAFFEKAIQSLCEHQSFWSIADATKSEQIIQLIMKQEDKLWRNTEWWRGIEEARRKHEEKKSAKQE